MFSMVNGSVTTRAREGGLTEPSRLPPASNPC